MPRQPEAISCGEVLEHLEAHLDEELDAAASSALESHLHACPACAAEYQLAAAIRRELRALPELDAPPAVLENITRRAEPRPLPFRAPVPARRHAWAGLAAAVFAAAVLGTSLWWGALRQEPASVPVGIPDRNESVADADPEDVARAAAEVRYALAYLTRVHRRAGLKLRDDLFVDRVARPSAESLARSLSPRLGRGTADPEERGSNRRDRS